MTKRFTLPKNVHSSDVLWELPDYLALAAVGLWAVMGSYARKHDTGGHVPSDVLRRWDAPEGCLDALSAASIITPTGGGFKFVDWKE